MRGKHVAHRGFLYGAVLVAALVASCAATGGKAGFSATSGSGGASGGGAGTGHGGAQGTGGEMPDGAFFDVPVGDSSSLGCSGDLHSVIDGNGQIVQTCPADQGCDGGKCVPACTAAGDSHGNVGCDFLLSTPSFHTPFQPPCLAASVANDWPEPAMLTVSRAGQTYDVTTFGRIAGSGSDATQWPAVPATGLPQGKVAVLFLTSAPGAPFPCPVAPAVAASTAVYTGTAGASGRGQSFHIQSSAPVTVYDILPYGGARSYLPAAELVLPTTAWGTNYVAVVPPQPGPITQGARWGQIVASVDGTNVKIVPTVDLPAGPNVSAAPANTLTQYTLAAGEFVQWQDTGDMSGSVIQSDQPVAFVGGDTYLCLTSKTSPLGGGCDSAHQIIPPVSALGSEYVAPPYATRRADLQPESILYRIVATVAGTTFTYDPPVPGAPATLDVGGVADFETTLAFNVTSQDAGHPFYVAQLMSGCHTTSGSRPGASDIPNVCDPACLGDEEFVNLLPPAQYLEQYVFFTDPTYWTTNLVFVRVKKGSSFADVTLDCAGTLTGWQDVGTSGKYQITNIDLVRANAPQGMCNNGPHVAKSDGAFGVMVWGEDCASSYAYPAGGNVAVINDVVVPPITK